MRQFIKESDKELIIQLYRDNYGSIYRYFLKRLGSSEDASDAAQEVFKRFIGRNSVATLDSPVGYLWRITHPLPQPSAFFIYWGDQQENAAN